MSGGPSISSEQFRQVLEVSRMLAATTELDELLNHIAKAATSLLNCERASIFLHDAKTDELWTKVALLSKEIRVPSHAGIVGSVFKSNQILHVPMPYDDPRFNREVDRKSGFVTRNLLTAPMVNVDRKPVGVIQAVNNRTADGFSEIESAMIQLLADQAGVAIQRFHLQQSELEAHEMRREMDLARTVQRALLPTDPPRISGLSCIGWTRAASMTGGDCYDLWKTGDGRLGIFVADATGHGIGPALVVSQTRTLIRAMCDRLPDPTELLSCATARLSEDLSSGQFVTAFLGFLSTDGTLIWSSAGHGPVLVRQSANTSFEVLDPPEPPLGILPEFESAAPATITIGPGGLLAVLSDGVFKAHQPSGSEDTMFGHEKVIEILSDPKQREIDKLLQSTIADVTNWQGKDEPADDQTIVYVAR